MGIKSGCQKQSLKLLPAFPSRGFMSAALDEPVLVVRALNFQEGLAQFLHGAEGPHPLPFFFEDAGKAFGTAVALRGPDKAEELMMPKRPIGD